MYYYNFSENNIIFLKARGSLFNTITFTVIKTYNHEKYTFLFIHFINSKLYYP